MSDYSPRGTRCTFESSSFGQEINLLAEETMFKDPRKRAQLNKDGADKPLRSPIFKETLAKARRYRKQRMVDEVARRDCAAILLYDPINIRYVFDISSMQVWALHNQFHYALVFADGYGIDFGYTGSEHISNGLENINEQRTGVLWYYMATGDRQPERVGIWADEIVAELHKRGGKNMRLAVDRCDLLGIRTLETRGVQIVEGWELTDMARRIKSPEELELMQWSIRVCEAGLARMYEHSLPGKSEQEIWAELHYENIRSGGEWIETRLLTIGRRTNPWYQEASPHVGEEGDILTVDTDMIGPYGYCADVSRTWTIGHTRLRPKQRDLYAAALEQIQHNTSLLRAGLSFAEFNEKSWRIPDKYLANRYSLAIHGVGMADEYPVVPLHPDFAKAYSGHFEAGEVICVESLIGEQVGEACVKLETQVVIEENGARRLDSFPWLD